MKQVNIQIPLRMLGLILGLFLSVGAFAQIEVKGHVKDAAGEDIIGATVRVEGTQTATVSDFDGNFVLKAKEGATISVSYVGYQTATVKAAPTVERPDRFCNGSEAGFKEQGSGGERSGHAAR